MQQADMRGQMAARPSRAQWPATARRSLPRRNVAQARCAWVCGRPSPPRPAGRIAPSAAAAPPPPHPHARCRAAARPQEPLPSLIPSTLEELDADGELLALHARLAAEGQAALTREEAARRRRSLAGLGVASFGSVCGPLRRGPAAILQLNIGLYCNQACRHCHVESSPRRTEEVMGAAVAQRCAELMASCPSLTTVDLTGGAPELCPQFRWGCWGG